MSEEEEARETRVTSELYMTHPICADIYEVMQKVNEANIHTSTPREVEEHVTEKDCDQILFCLQALESMLDAGINKLKAMKAITELRRISVENAVDELHIAQRTREDEAPTDVSPEELTGLMMSQ